MRDAKCKRLATWDGKPDGSSSSFSALLQRMFRQRRWSVLGLAAALPCHSGHRVQTLRCCNIHAEQV